MTKVASLFLAGMAFLVTHSLAAGPPEAFKNDVLTQHNKARAMYGAEPLTWSDALYPETLQWANTCKFQHSASKGQYGENIYAGEAPSATFAESMEAWMSEASKYTYDNPAFSEATGMEVGYRITIV
ncbi:hypothetical protein DFQ26_006095, partial [Actinomortierella ambigua]